MSPPSSSATACSKASARSSRPPNTCSRTPPGPPRDEGQVRLPADRHPRRARASAARRRRPRRSHRGRRHRRRRSRAVLGPAPASRLAARARAARRARPARRSGVPRPLEYRGLMADLPEPAIAREWLQTMTLIRRFEERAGEMYARAKVGGFLHLSIGEEATIVGSARALRDSDYLISTYRSHGHALVRGTPPENVMAELFGRADGCSGGRGGSMHMFDLARRFMGGYGIVGGNLPIAAGIALASDYQGTEEITLCTFGDGASNQGTFGETLNLAALWKLPVVFMVTNNQFGMGTALRRDGRARHPRGPDRGGGARARRPPSGAGGGRDLPLSRPLDGRPGAVPDQGGGRQVASARPDPRVCRAAHQRGRPRRGRARADRRGGDRAGGRGGRVRRGLPVPRAGVPVRRRVRAGPRGPRLVLAAEHRSGSRRLARLGAGRGREPRRGGAGGQRRDPAAALARAGRGRGWARSTRTPPPKRLMAQMRY